MSRPIPISAGSCTLTFPETGEKSWKAYHKRRIQTLTQIDKITRSKIYVHPFVQGDTTTNRYEVILQYWLFYPFNDGGNNHEGDWEHINVWITHQNAAASAWTEGQIAKLWQGSKTDFETCLKPLVIKKVDYYFHNYVMTLDYEKLDHFSGKEDFQQQLSNHQERTHFGKWIQERINNRIHLGQDSINTHTDCLYRWRQYGLMTNS